MFNFVLFLAIFLTSSICKIKLLQNQKAQIFFPQNFEITLSQGLSLAKKFSFTLNFYGKNTIPIHPPFVYCFVSITLLHFQHFS